MRSLVFCPDPVLHRRADEVVVFGEWLKQLAEEMKVLMVDHGGVGLAAPQVGESLRLFVMKSHDGETLVLVNPVLVNASNYTQEGMEGCLSLPDIAGAKVHRFEWIEYEARDVEGNPIKDKLRGFSARVFQHELDHLNGITILERAPRSKVVALDQA